MSNWRIATSFLGENWSSSAQIIFFFGAKLLHPTDDAAADAALCYVIQEYGKERCLMRGENDFLRLPPPPFYCAAAAAAAAALIGIIISGETRRWA